MAEWGCPTRLHVIRLLAPSLAYEDHAKNVDFSPKGIKPRWEAGDRQTCETLDKADWREPVDPLEGFNRHEACGGEMVVTAATK